MSPPAGGAIGLPGLRAGKSGNRLRADKVEKRGEMKREAKGVKRNALPDANRFGIMVLGEESGVTAAEVSVEHRGERAAEKLLRAKHLDLFPRLVSHGRICFTRGRVLFHGGVGRNVLLTFHVQREPLERLAEAGGVDRACGFVDESLLDHHLEHAREQLLLQIMKLLVLVRPMQIENGVALLAILGVRRIELVADAADDRLKLTLALLMWREAILAKDGVVHIGVDEVRVRAAGHVAIRRPAEVEFRLLLVHDCVREDVGDAAVPEDVWV